MYAFDDDEAMFHAFRGASSEAGLLVVTRSRVATRRCDFIFLFGNLICVISIPCHLIFFITSKNTRALQRDLICIGIRLRTIATCELF
jgi:hypothetical protein